MVLIKMLVPGAIPKQHLKQLYDKTMPDVNTYCEEHTCCEQRGLLEFASAQFNPRCQPTVVLFSRATT
jgi:hypothetical protein